MKTTLHGPDGIKLELDSNEVYPGDPGQGTPALVVLANDDTASYSCAVNEGETCDGTQLTPGQVAWLESHEDTVNSFIDQAIARATA